MNAKKESSEPLLTHVRQPRTPTPAPPKVVCRRQPLSLKVKIGLVLDAIVFVLPLAIDIPHLDEPGERISVIFPLAIVFWIAESIALNVTTVLVIGLEVTTVSDRALVDPTLGDAVLVDQVTSYKSYFATLTNPMITLFMGEFMTAGGAAKYELDKNPAAVMPKPFPKNARLTILGPMPITTMLSMFMSNTVTTATMFTVVIPALTILPKGKARVEVALSIPLAVNVGGTGIPAGTLPNAIATGALVEKGIAIPFIQRMILVISLTLVILFAFWAFLSLMFIPKNVEINIGISTSRNRSFAAVSLYIIAGTTILPWMIESIHDVSSAVVGFLPVVVLLSLRVMTGEDIKKLDWLVLWLVVGGTVLGEGVGAAGLGTRMVGSTPWDSFSPMLIAAVTSLIGFATANVISHSASANLLTLLAVTLVVSLESVDTVTVAVIVATACSLGMSLPISTSPNAIAYSTREVEVKEMTTLGIAVGSMSIIVLVLVMPPLWQLLGLVQQGPCLKSSGGSPLGSAS